MARLPKIQAVLVRFDGSYKDYEFKTNLDLAINDIVRCDTSIGVSVGRVYQVKPNPTAAATRWVIDQIETKTYDVKTHRERVQKFEALVELKKKMEKRRKQIEDVDVYRQLAEGDDEMKLLLAEYETAQQLAYVEEA